MKHPLLKKVYEKYGTDKPHKAPGADVKDVKEEEVKRPLSPVEPSSGTVATELPIQVKTDGDDKAEAISIKNTVDVKEEREVKAEGSSAQAQSCATASADVKDETKPKPGPGRGRKKAADDPNAKPYEGLFEATFKPDHDMFEIKDLRDIPGGDKTWLEEAHCLLCNSRII